MKVPADLPLVRLLDRRFDATPAGKRGGIHGIQRVLVCVAEQISEKLNREVPTIRDFLEFRITIERDMEYLERVPPPQIVISHRVGAQSLNIIQKELVHLIGTKLQIVKRYEKHSYPEQKYRLLTGERM